MVSIPLLKTGQLSLEFSQPFQTKESHLSLKDLLKCRSLAGVETEPKLPAFLTEHPDHLRTLWHLVNICPVLLLEDLKPSCTAPTWSLFQAFLIPDATPVTVISYGPLFPKSPTDPYVVEQSIQCCMDASRKQDQEFTIITFDQAIYEVVLGLKKKTPEMSQTYLAHGWLPYCSKLPRSDWAFDAGHWK